VLLSSHIGVPAERWKMTTAHSDRRWVTGDAHPDIVTVGDPLLKEPLEPVTDIPAAQRLFDRMIELLRQLNGAGLAAPQIGVSTAAIVIEVRKTDLFPDRAESALLEMANPRLVHSSSDLEYGWEGCFSVPGLMGLVPRHRAITVEFINRDGDELSETYEGYLARVIQHELDHLDGHVFLERMSSMESMTTVSNWVRFHHTSLSRP
jgi:peptide deformylase